MMYVVELIRSDSLPLFKDGRMPTSSSFSLSNLLYGPQCHVCKFKVKQNFGPDKSETILQYFQYSSLYTGFPIEYVVLTVQRLQSFTKESRSVKFDTKEVGVTGLVSGGVAEGVSGFPSSDRHRGGTRFFSSKRDSQTVCLED